MNQFDDLKYKDKETGQVLYGFSQDDLNKVAREQEIIKTLLMHVVRLGYMVFASILVFIGWVVYMVLKYHLITDLLKAINGGY